jgi:GTP-binding protein
MTLSLNRILRKYLVPRILVFNEANLKAGVENSGQFFGLNYHFSISAFTESNLEQLVKKIVELLPNSNKEEWEVENPQVNLLIFGPPNSGKSTLMNYLLQKNRSLVTPLAGTTQEPVISQWS